MFRSAVMGAESVIMFKDYNFYLVNESTILKLISLFIFNNSTQNYKK
jgi:hypothetical protein